MEQPIDHYWRIRLAADKHTLEANHFDVYLAENAAEANQMIPGKIIPATGYCLSMK